MDHKKYVEPKEDFDYNWIMASRDDGSTAMKGKTK
jgi:hypothetical protein